jgi:hypothetical protein
MIVTNRRCAEDQTGLTATPTLKGSHMLNNLSGIGALQDALSTTNTLLEAVLVQLKETNSERLDGIAKELRALNEKLDQNPLG